MEDLATDMPVDGTVSDPPGITSPTKPSRRLVALAGMWLLCIALIGVGVSLWGHVGAGLVTAGVLGAAWAWMIFGEVAERTPAPADPTTAAPRPSTPSPFVSEKKPR